MKRESQSDKFYRRMNQEYNAAIHRRNKEEVEYKQENGIELDFSDRVFLFGEKVSGVIGTLLLLTVVIGAVILAVYFLIAIVYAVFF